jgi:hypothetical protein
MKLILTFFLFTALAHAEVFKLAEITSEFDKDVSHFYLETDDSHKIHSMRYVTIMPNGGIFEDVTLTAEEIMDRGAVLVVRDNHEAVRLEVEKFDLYQGGGVKLNYLYNGVRNTRGIKRLQLVLENGAFFLKDGDKKINRMFFKANWVRVLGVVGIREIVTSYQE